MDFKTEVQIRQEIADLWAMLSAERHMREVLAFAGLDVNKLFTMLQERRIGKDVIAVLNGDGGHRQAEVGVEKAAEEGMAKYNAMHTRIDELETWQREAIEWFRGELDRSRATEGFLRALLARVKP